MKSVLTLLLAFIAFSSLGQSGKKQKLPFGELKYRSDEKFIRVRISERGPDPEVALKIARLNARGEIVRQIQNALDVAAKSSVNQDKQNDKSDTEKKYKEVIEEKAQMMLIGSSAIAEDRYYDKKNKSYEVWIVMEWPIQSPTKEAINEIRETLPIDVREQLKQEVFEQNFRNELRKN